MIRSRPNSSAYSEGWDRIWGAKRSDEPAAPQEEQSTTAVITAIVPHHPAGAASIIRPDFPEIIDSSLIAAFRSCPHKMFLGYIEHWKGKEENVHLHAGKAYAHGLEVARKAFYEDGKSAEDSVALGLGALLQSYGTFQCPEDSGKSATRMAGALEFHFARYPLGEDKAVPLSLPDGKKAIEFGGVEILDVLHPVTGNPLQYSWRMDMAVMWDGMKLGMDDKTTSRLGATWPKQWDLRSQFTAYTWGADVGAYKMGLQGFLVRGISILKRDYDTLQAITYRPRWQLERWHEQVHRDIRRMIRCWEEGYWDYALDSACEEYGGCQFRNACLMHEPQQLLEQHFQRRRWDPIRREEILLVQQEDGTWK